MDEYCFEKYMSPTLYSLGRFKKYHVIYHEKHKIMPLHASTITQINNAIFKETIIIYCDFLK